MSISIETYFWLVDRLKIEDDSKNKVNMTKNQVTLSKVFLKKCENGLYIGQLLREIYPTYVNRVAREFSIPPAVTDITADTPAFSQPVWKHIFDGLSMYGCKLEPQKQDQIVKMAKTEQVLELFDCLFEIDSSPNGQISAQTKRKVGIKNNQNNLSARPAFNNDLASSIDLDTPGRNLKGTIEPSSARKGSAAIQRGKKLNPLQDIVSPIRRGDYDSPERVGGAVSLKKSPSAGNLAQSPGTAKSPSTRILGKEASLMNDFEVDQLEKVMPTSLDACKTSFQFILFSLSLAFDMKPKQAAALLTNNNKYLMHLCVKGSKGANFENVRGWYDTMLPYASLLINLVATERKDYLSFHTPLTAISSKAGDAKENRGKIMIKTFNILKGGLYSRNQDVQVSAGQFFSFIFHEINDKIPDMGGDIIEWLTTKTVHPEFKRQSSIRTGKSRDETSKLTMGSHLVGKSGKGKIPTEEESEMKQAIGSKELDLFQYQTGTQAILFAYVSNDEFIESAVDMMLQIGRINAIQFFTQQLIAQVPTWSLYGNICCDTFRKSLGTDLASQVIQESGVLQFWIVQSLKIAESNSEVPLNDRIVSLVFMTEIWLARPQFFAKILNNAPDAIMKILKKGARDVRKTLCIVSIELMFRLLLNFASERHSFAPTIYKTLTFLLVEFYWEIDVRELMLRHFFDLFASFESIPINILCEPLFKQIGISQYHETSFNVFDFEFFSIVANHTKLTIPTALQLIDSLSKIAMTSVFYQSYSISIITTLMQRFKDYPELVDHWRDSFRQIMSMIVNMEARFAVHRHHLRQEENNFFNRLALRNKKSKVEVDPTGGRMSDQDYLVCKTNMRLAVNLIEKIIKFQDPQINKDLKNQLMDTFIGIQSGLKIECKGIAYLLKFFTNKVHAMIEERQVNQPQAQQIVNPYARELQQLQNNQSQSPGRGGSGDRGSGNLLQRKLSQPKLPPPVLGAPVHHPDRQFQVSVALPINEGAKKRHVELSQALYEYLKWEEEWEVKQYNQFLKKHQKLYKQLHKSYINENSAKKPLAIARTTFEENEKTVDQITAASLIKLIKDFRLENGINQTILKEEVIKLVKQINIHVLKQTGDVQTLDFEGFVNFMLQYAHLQHQTESQHKAYQVIEKLIGQLMQSPMYQKLGLVTNKVDQTASKNELVKALDQRLNSKEPEKQNQNFKVKEDLITTVKYLVHPAIPISDSRRVCVELLDEIFFGGLGVHFLEPVTVQTTIKKIIPNLVSIRKVSVQPISGTNRGTRGITSNMPLSQALPLSSNQEEAQQKFMQDREQKQQEKQNREYTKAIESIEKGDVDPKERFKSQAIERRASKFGPSMQMSIIDAGNYHEKQNMFECAQVLDEILTAVEKGKKNLRLDFTPYKLYELRKKKTVNEPQPSVSEEPLEIDHAEKERKQEAVSQFLARHGHYIEQQKEEKAKADAKKQRQEERKQELKEKIAQEYEITKEETKKNGGQERQEKNRQKLEERERANAEKEQRKHDADAKIRGFVNQHEQDLRILEAETQKKRHKDETKEEREKGKAKRLAEKQSSLHQYVVQDNSKQLMRDKFYSFLGSGSMKNLLNSRFKTGLYIKYEKCQRMSAKTTGVTQSAWLDWLKQSGVTQKVDSKQIVNIHTSQVKDMREMPECGKDVQTDLKAADAVPAEKELNYQGFVIALVKVANVGKMKFRDDQNDKEPASKNREYEITDFSVEDVVRFFKFIEMAGK